LRARVELRLNSKSGFSPKKLIVWYLSSKAASRGKRPAASQP
jgi:hypothetical protein